MIHAGVYCGTEWVVHLSHLIRTTRSCGRWKKDPEAGPRRAAGSPRPLVTGRAATAWLAVMVNAAEPRIAPGEWSEISRREAFSGA